MKPKAFKLTLADLPKITPPDGIGCEQVILDCDPRISKNLERVTRTFLPPGKAYGPDLHESLDEMFLVVHGRGEVVGDGQLVFEFKEGDFVCVPANVQHIYRNTGSTDCELIFFQIRKAS